MCAARLSSGVVRDVRDLLGLPLGRRGSCVARTRPQIRQKLSATVSFCYGVAISSMNSQVVRVDFVLEGFRCAEDSVSIHNLVQFMSTRCMHLFLDFFLHCSFSHLGTSRCLKYATTGIPGCFSWCLVSTVCFSKFATHTLTSEM